LCIRKLDRNIERNVNFDDLQKKGHFKKKYILKLRKMFSVDHKNQFFICQSSFLQKIKKIEEETHFFLNFEKLKKKSSMTGHPF
jgi:hypothetical protein